MTQAAAGLTSAAAGHLGLAARWWFDNAPHQPLPPAGLPRQAHAQSTLSRRHWRLLGETDVVPEPGDGTWLAMAAASPAQLMAAAVLFDVMALVQAPRIDSAWPALMQLPDARWAASVAAIQPFQRLHHWAAADSPEGAVRGMLELRPRLERQHAGLWGRCLQAWPMALQRALRPPVAGAPACVEPEASARRAWRGWQQCLARVRGQP
jgi:hypothetical protein